MVNCGSEGGNGPSHRDEVAVAEEPNQPEERVRLQMDVAASKDREIREIMDLIEARTKAELLNNALALFQWAVAEKAKGRSIASVDEEAGSVRELLMPSLETVRRKYESKGGDGSSG